MKYLQSIEVKEQNKEEILPSFTQEFPYIATCAELNKYIALQTPWHWHKTVELFYMQSGILEYTTPKGKWVFSAGSGGFVNPNVLHTSRVIPSSDSAVQLLHLFDTVLLSGEHGSRIEAKYILPLTATSGIEMIPLYPANPTHAEILEDIKNALTLSEQAWGYEFRLREALTQIWLKLFSLACPNRAPCECQDSDDTIKLLMVYIHENFCQPISVEQLAKVAHISKRACFRLFRQTLHMSPVEYIRNARLQQACRMLATDKESVTQIAYRCGLGTSSYFGKVFREKFGCSPLEYRRRWHNRNNNRHT